MRSIPNETQKDEKHTERDTEMGAINREKSIPAKKRKTKSRTIADMLKQMGEDDDIEENDACAAEGSCTIQSYCGEVALWFSCQRCSAWYHTICVQLENKTAADIESFQYVCPLCS